MHISIIRTYHGAVYIMIKVNTIFISAQMAICGHRNFDAFAILHAEFPQYILEVFLLRYEYVIALTNLKI